jgi:hypothetical protein
VHAVCVEEKRSAQGMLVRKPERCRYLGDVIVDDRIILIPILKK